MINELKRIQSNNRELDKFQEYVRELFADTRQALLTLESSVSSNSTNISGNDTDISSIQTRLSGQRIPRPGFENETTSATTLTIPASSGSPAYFLIGGEYYSVTSDIAVDLSGTGLNGLDEGSLVARTPYYLYAVVSGGTVYGVASDNPPSTGPTGYSDWTYIGAFATLNGLAALNEFKSSSGIMYSGSGFDAVNHTGSTSVTSVSLVTLPITVKSAYLNVRVGSGSTGNDFTLGPSADSLGALFLEEGGSARRRALGWCPIVEDQTVYSQLENSSTIATIYTFGWQENPMEWK